MRAGGLPRRRRARARARVLLAGRRSRRSSSIRWCRSRTIVSACSRPFASTRSSGSTTDARDRHRDLFLALAERAHEDVLSPRQPAAFAALDEEAANLAAAIEHALATDPAKALRLCLALDFWFRARARFREADAAFARALAAARPADRRCGHGRSRRGPGSSAPRATSRAPTRWRPRRRAAATPGRSSCSPTTASSPIRPRAIALLEHCRGADDEYIAARAEALLRGAAWFRQDEAACVEAFDALRARLERLGDRETLAWFWFEQGALRHPLGEHAEAAALLRRAVAVAAEVGEPTADRAARSHLALLDLAAGRADEARAELHAIHDQTLLHGGSFALPWISLLVGVADAGLRRPRGGPRRGSRTLVELQAWGAAHALAWASAELAEVQRLLGDAAARGRGRARARTSARARQPVARGQGPDSPGVRPLNIATGRRAK